MGNEKYAIVDKSMAKWICQEITTYNSSHFHGVNFLALSRSTLKSIVDRQARNHLATLPWLISLTSTGQMVKIATTGLHIKLLASFSVNKFMRLVLSAPSDLLVKRFTGIVMVATQAHNLVV